MKKWKFTLALLFVIIIIWQGIRLYSSILDTQRDLQQRAVAKAMRQAELSEVLDVNFFHGTSAYQVIFGLNKNDQKIIVWVPKDTNKNIMVKLAKEGWTKKQVKEHVIKERDPLSIKEIRLGMNNGQPLWEVTYIDNQNRFTYYYLDFESGAFLKRYSLKLKKFKGEF